MDLSINACKILASLLHGFIITKTNRSICNSSGSKINLMAVKRGERVVSALNSLSSDGLSLPGEEEKVWVLIEEYFFDDSADDSRSDESDNESVISHILFCCCVMCFPYVGFIGL